MGKKITFDVEELKDELKFFEEVKVFGETVNINRIVDLKSQELIVESFLVRMFDKDVPTPSPFSRYTDEDIISAELGLRTDFIRYLTNIDVEKISEGILLNDGIFETLSAHVINWDSFIENLYEIVESVREKRALDKSIGQVLDFALSRLIEFSDSDKFSDLISYIEKVGKTIDKSNLGGLMKESSQQSSKKE